MPTNRERRAPRISARTLQGAAAASASMDAVDAPDTLPPRAIWHDTFREYLWQTRSFANDRTQLTNWFNDESRRVRASFGQSTGARNSTRERMVSHAMECVFLTRTRIIARDARWRQANEAYQREVISIRERCPVIDRVSEQLQNQRLANARQMYMNHERTINTTEIVPIPAYLPGELRMDNVGRAILPESSNSFYVGATRTNGDITEVWVVNSDGEGRWEVQSPAVMQPRRPTVSGACDGQRHALGVDYWFWILDSEGIGHWEIQGRYYVRYRSTPVPQQPPEIVVDIQFSPTPTSTARRSTVRARESVWGDDPVDTDMPALAREQDRIIDSFHERTERIAARIFADESVSSSSQVELICNGQKSLVKLRARTSACVDIQVMTPRGSYARNVMRIGAIRDNRQFQFVRLPVRFEGFTHGLHTVRSARDVGYRLIRERKEVL